MDDLFSENSSPPLADRLRPRNLDEFAGQEGVVGDGKILRKILEKGELDSSLVFWGPPGCGKTTLAHIIAGAVDAHFESFSAVTSGVAEVRRIVAEAERRLKLNQRRTILFVDEIHRFNKAQQDAFLPHIEKGIIVLIGATTENPSFEVVGPLLSRCRVFVLEPLGEEDITAILKRAIDDRERGLGETGVKASERTLRYLANLSGGDARTSLNALEMAVQSMKTEEGDVEITPEMVEEAIQKRNLLYDKGGEEHYNIISALHKSMRGGDADASLYWLARMLEAGEDPLYVARRLVRFASEDIGNADPKALRVALDAMEAFRFVGLPEGKLALAQAVTYLATAPRSNAIYTGYAAASGDVKRHGTLPVPLWIRNAPTRLMKELGYGDGYLYPHDEEEGVVDQEYFPDQLAGRRYYHPVERGFEREIIKRMKYWRRLREKRKKKGND